MSPAGALFSLVDLALQRDASVPAGRLDPYVRLADLAGELMPPHQRTHLPRTVPGSPDPRGSILRLGPARRNARAPAPAPAGQLGAAPTEPPSLDAFAADQLEEVIPITELAAA